MSFLSPTKCQKNVPSTQTRVIQRQTNASSIRTMSQEDLGPGAKYYSGVEIPNTAKKYDRACYAKALYAKGMRVEDIAQNIDASVSYTYKLLRF